MKNTYNSINENEKKRILEMHKKGGYTSLNEQSEPTLDNRFTGDKFTRNPGLDDDARQAKNDVKIPDNIIIDGSLFKNGIANIDKSNPQYKTAIRQLKELPADMTVNIEGGASAVGSQSGYDNDKLANLRATNFINAAKQDGVKVNMTPSGFVGSAKVKNSPQAEAEQYVKINFTKGGGYRPETAVDKTRTDKRLGGATLDQEKIKRGIKRYKICLKDLTYDEYINVFRTYNSKNKIDRGSISSK